VLSGLLIFGLSIIFSYILTLVINKILIKSLAFYYSSKIIPNLQILFFNFPLILIDLIVVMTATITASIIPLFITRKVKPINIIKARE
jgi:ABC-type antimicrobial peptide transport system permease subunit